LPAWEIAGRAQFHVQPRFQNAARRAKPEGYSHFIIDLSECVLMDSTFLGVLAGFGLKDHARRRARQVRHRTGQPQHARFRIAGKSRGAAAVQSHDRPAAIAGKCRGLRARNGQPHADGNHAHQPGGAIKRSLAANPDNVARFKDVAQFLARI